MAGLKAIKTKIRSIDKSRQVTKAMEAVSAAKMRKGQQRAITGRPFAKAALHILSNLSGTQDMKHHPLAAKRPISHALYIVITSDKGLAGALNSSVLRSVAADIALQGLTREQVTVIAVGRKAQDFFQARGITVAVFHPNTEAVTPELVEALVQEATNRFVFKTVGVVKVAYQQFVSTFEQRPTLRTVLPLSLEELSQVVHDITPARGLYAEPEVVERVPVYTIEPSEKEVVDAIVPRLVGIFVYHALLESQASEHSARMVAMKSASDKASELKQELTLDFNKARQAAITQEVSEIIGGMEALVG